VVYSMGTFEKPTQSAGSRRYLEDLLEKVRQESDRRDYQTRERSGSGG
jgi:hypothetical protein